MQTPTPAVRFVPRHDNILLRPPAIEEKTLGGILLPDNVKAQQNKTGTEGVVVAIGPGKLQPDGKRSPMSVAVGERVLFRSYATAEVTIDGALYWYISDNDVVGTFTPKPDPLAAPQAADGASVPV